MRATKIYLETTLFNFYVDDDRGFPHESTVELFNEAAAGKYEAYTSAYVLDELEKAPPEKRNKMMELIARHNVSVLTYSDEAQALADVYVAEGVIPPKYRTDALHIAIAAVNDLDIIVSMNFQHIVKRRTKLATGSINALNGYRPVEISTPMEITE
jgi:predicted nucleic acid-binding protein